MREPIPLDPPRRPPREPRPYSRHGYHALKRKVLVAGTDALDRRSVSARELLAWADNQVSHLGGKGDVTHPEMTLVKRASVLEILIRQAETHLLARGVAVARKAGQKTLRPHPLLTEYRALIREQREILSDLGLRRRAVPALSLDAAIEAAKQNGHA
jgi:hypothetical protein